MNSIKKVFYATCITLFSIELICRIFIFLFTFNTSVFLYGIDKTFSFNIIDLSELKFAITPDEVSKDNLKILNKNEKILIWTFGGSTTAGFEPNCGHSTSSWPLELSKLDNNIEVVNFAKQGTTTNLAIQQYFKNRLNQKPNYILWANKINEEFNGKVVDSNRNLVFLTKVYKTIKTNLIMVYLYDDLLQKIKIHVFKQEIKYPKTGYKEYWKEAIDNYNNNTKVAVNLSKKDGSNFYIVSIFTEYDFDKNQFFRKDFFDLWENNAKKLSEKYQINYLDTEKLVRENLQYFDKEKKYFCEKDKVHQTVLGNQITAKLIYNYLFN